MSGWVLKAIVSTGPESDRNNQRLYSPPIPETNVAKPALLAILISLTATPLAPHGHSAAQKLAALRMQAAKRPGMPHVSGGQPGRAKLAAPGAERGGED